MWKCFFQNCCPEHPNNAFFVPNLRILVFAKKTLQLDRLESVDYKYDNSFSTFQPKDPNWAFLAPGLIFFVFDEIL